jgi:hypothetical protein
MPKIYVGEILPLGVPFIGSAYRPFLSSKLQAKARGLLSDDENVYKWPVVEGQPSTTTHVD